MKKPGTSTVLLDVNGLRGNTLNGAGIFNHLRRRFRFMHKVGMGSAPGFKLGGGGGPRDPAGPGSYVPAWYLPILQKNNRKQAENKVFSQIRISSYI